MLFDKPSPGICKLPSCLLCNFVSCTCLTRSSYALHVAQSLISRQTPERGRTSCAGQLGVALEREARQHHPSRSYAGANVDAHCHCKWHGRSKQDKQTQNQQCQNNWQEEGQHQCLWTCVNYSLKAGVPGPLTASVYGQNFHNGACTMLLSGHSTPNWQYCKQSCKICQTCKTASDFDRLASSNGLKAACSSPFLPYPMDISA